MKLKNSSKLILRDIVICLLLMVAGFIAAKLVGSFDLNWFTVITKESVQDTLSILADLATILGVGVAIYVYKSWYKQQHFIKKDKILDDLYLTFLDFYSSSTLLASLKQAKFNMYESYYINNQSPQSYKIKDLEQYTREVDETYSTNLKKYDSVFDSLSIVFSGMDYYEINSHRITTSFNKLDREIDKAIKSNNFNQCKSLIEGECNFIRDFYKIFSEYTKRLR